MDPDYWVPRIRSEQEVRMSGLRRWALPGLAGVGYVGLAVAATRGLDGLDRKAFAEVNDDQKRSWLRAPQQVGTPWVLPLLAGVAWWRDEHRLALAAAAALPVEKSAEVLTKKLSGRPRPVHTVPATRLRDDAPTDGPSYPSGHAAIACCAVTLLGRWAGAPVAVPGTLVALLTGVTRVHQGAHYPGDVLGGALLGVAIGSALGEAMELDWLPDALF
jgi:undecaprenyl-diphosphatase